MRNAIFRFEIGYKFIPRARKSRPIWTISDRLTVMNDKGQAVKTYYECTSEFMGQTIPIHEVAHSTVAMGQPV